MKKPEKHSKKETTKTYAEEDEDQSSSSSSSSSCSLNNSSYISFPEPQFTANCFVFDFPNCFDLLDKKIDTYMTLPQKLRQECMDTYVTWNKKLIRDGRSSLCAIGKPTLETISEEDEENEELKGAEHIDQ